VGRDANMTVIIEADEGVAHGTVVHVMELAKDAGLVKLAIATRASQ
jgi:biopolymer transport protein ExbD